MLLGAGAPAEPARKEFLRVTVRADSASAQRFTFENQGFHVWSRRAGATGRQPTVSDTLEIVGAGTLELVSADSTRPLSVDVWLVSAEWHAPVRHTGRVVTVQRASPMEPYRVTSR
jgi:hypothetical protein